MTKHFTLLAASILMLLIQPARSQNDPYFIPGTFKNAIENGTRNTDGTPGEKYWINHADYNIDVDVHPETGMIKGSAGITYFNNSPDSLKYILFRLYQDIYRKGNARQFSIGNVDLTDGVEISNIEIDGTAYDPASRKVNRSSSNMYVRLDRPIPPHSKADVKIGWSFKMPQKRWIRFGQYNPNHLFVAYWYPQIAVYDDINGWDRIEYAGMVEFYNDPNNFDVNITVPGNFVVWATGVLQNPSEILGRDVLRKYEEAKTSDEVVQIIRHDDYSSENVTKSGDKNTWHFKAEGVPDFAFAASYGSAWDALSPVVDGSSGRRVMISAVYPDSVVHYEDVAGIARNAVEYMSNELPGVPFPYPEVTVFANGRKNGGMEFPMMVNDGAPDDYADLEGLTFHEISHNYFPFFMGTNERRYAFMDEGWARYLPTGFLEKYAPEDPYFQRTINQYNSFAGSVNELPPMIPTYIFNDYQTQRMAAYTRPATAYSVLRQIMGDDLFKAAMDEYIRRWNHKHPSPWDFFNTFNMVAGEDLSWFWNPWFFERGSADLTIKSLTPDNVILIQKVGIMPVPVQLTITFEDGSEATILKNARVWADGEEMLAVPVMENKKIKTIALGNDLIPDTNPADNRWER